MGCCNSVSIPPLLSPSIIHLQNIPMKSPRISSLPRKKLLAITQKYQILRALGSGTIGSLFHAKDIETGEIRTIREINKSSSFDSEEIFQEAKILINLNHQNILKIYEPIIETSRSYYIVLENISGGTLSEKYQKNPIEGLLSKYVHSMFIGLEYLHNHGIVHCNLSQDYIVFDDNSKKSCIKIIGFMSARTKLENKGIDEKYLKYTWASPEVLKGEYTEKSDVWSAGVILYYLLTQRLPFPKGPKNVVVDNIIKGNVDFSNTAFLGLSFEAQSLLRSILKLKPEDRPSCKEILQHPWFYESKRNLPITYKLKEKLMKFQIPSGIARKILVYIIEQFLLTKKDYQVLKLFRSLDFTGEETVSRDEVANIFKQENVGFLNEDIEIIIEKFSLHNSTQVNYLDIMLGVTNWSKELKVHVLAKALNVKDHISLDLLNTKINTNKEEWDELSKQTQAIKGQILLTNLEIYLKKAIGY
ncbi:hypothetical protein SteCoe_18573 [Stentor coeruleus]|uniref:Protein kinase domain-containing protein n=1 Tax=Stentor coeruleus TaxID=5963 RepID=A0A1R2BWU0_9CILI|nr:hypothetical protein SteCoe_18573 [Stentor coeruleus]